MPTIPWKNTLYRLMLPLWAFRQHNAPSYPIEGEKTKALYHLCQKHHVVGGQLLFFDKGTFSADYSYGFARLEDQPVTQDTFFRLASISKLVLALGALTLVEQQKIGLTEDLRPIFSFLTHPAFPQKPITLYQLLTHTSAIVDGPMYRQSLINIISLDEVLAHQESFAPWAPGAAFTYSNLAFGIIGSLIEEISGLGLEEYMEKFVFTPLDMTAAFTLDALPPLTPVACNYVVLTKKRGQAHMAFNPDQRRQKAQPPLKPNPLFHYIYGPGSLYSNSHSLARLFPFFQQKGAPLLSQALFGTMVTTSVAYGPKSPGLFHGLDMLKIKEPRLHPGEIWGHQGFAYGVAQGIFYDPQSQKGFISLNSGCSIHRKNRLSSLSRDLIKTLL